MKPSYFSAGPENVPQDFVKPTKSFKRKVILSMLGLAAFFIVYLGLMIWFAKESLNAFSYLRSYRPDNEFSVLFAGVILLILAVFMFKSLIIFGKRTKNPYKQVTIADEPELVNFVNSVAEELGAPKPHKIYLSDRVNASVSYDLSLLNILFPSKKNLEIGIGLVNVMNLTEFKAILAHEFGHFAQRSMLLGRYVYVAQQIAEKIIYKRDALDRGLAVFGRIDIRISWIAWILMVLVWAIRSFVSVLFGVVAISERALSREMEYQADKVAVSVTGSDSLIFGLHKLQAADQAYHGSIELLERLIRDKKTVTNLFVLQSEYIERMGQVLDDPSYGKVPLNIVPDANYRVFKNAHVNPPQMWSTHPADSDREANAKKVYVPSQIDDRSASLLFADFTILCEEITSRILKNANIDIDETLTNEEAIQFMMKTVFSWESLSNKYKGVYLNRPVFSNVENASEMYDVVLEESPKNELLKLYSDEIKEKLDAHRELMDEINSLKNTQNEAVTGEKRKIVHRGIEIKRRQIPEILKQLLEEAHVLNNALIQHDKKCRKVHYEVLRELDIRYCSYHQSFVGSLVFAEHSIQGLQQRAQLLSHTLLIASADGRISESEVNEIVNSANSLYEIMRNTVLGLKKLELSQPLLEKLEVEKLMDIMEPFRFETADHQNIQAWINNYGGWLQVVGEAIQRVYHVCLDHLLFLEDGAQKAYLQGTPMPEFHATINYPEEFVRVKPNSETEPRLKLKFWDKFQGGIGLFPTIARFAAAGGILALAIVMTYIHPLVDVHIHNGLDREVLVYFDGARYEMPPLSNLEVFVEPVSVVRTKTTDGHLIETFRPEFTSGYNHYIYNVASASYLLEYRVVYGLPESYQNQTSKPNLIGATRWHPTFAKFIFRDPPSSIRSDGFNYFTVLDCFDKLDASQLPFVGPNDKDKETLRAVHLQWDVKESPVASQWLHMLKNTKSDKELLNKRLKLYPDEINSWRSLIDISSREEKANLEQKFDATFSKTGNPDFLYLKYRAMEDSEISKNGFIDGHLKYPTNRWFGLSAGYEYARSRDWKSSIEAFQVFEQSSPDHLASCSMLFRMARIYAAENGDEEVLDLASCVLVNQVQRVESGPLNSLEGYDVFYHLLNMGELAAAEKELLKFNSEDRTSLSILIAASSGCDEAFRIKTLDEINSTALVYYPPVIALCLLQGKDAAPFVSRYCTVNDLSPSQKQAVQGFVRCLKDGDIKLAETELESIENFVLRTELEMIGCIVLQRKAPAVWNREVRSILLPYERPYIEAI